MPSRLLLATAALCASAVLLPSQAAAAQRQAVLLKEGTGMHANPSIRVRAVQRALVRRGYSVGAPGIDGRFGPLTSRAVRQFQVRSHLQADGIVGPRTRQKLGLTLHGSRLVERRAGRAEHRRRAPAASHHRPRARAGPGARRRTTRPTAAVPAPATTPATTRDDGSGTPLLRIALLALFAAGAALAAVRVRRRPRRATPPAPNPPAPAERATPAERPASAERVLPRSRPAASSPPPPPEPARRHAPHQPPRHTPRPVASTPAVPRTDGTEPELVERIAAMRRADMTLQAIADRLNGDHAETLPRNTRWRPSDVRAALSGRRRER